jgi:hypothetical protein
MIHELSFFTDRVGHNVYRISAQGSKTGAVYITSAVHANELYQAQEKNNDCFTKCAFLEVTPPLTKLVVDGRKFKGDFITLLRAVEREEMTIANAHELSPFYQQEYQKILDLRK